MSEHDEPGTGARGDDEGEALDPSAASTFADLDLRPEVLAALGRLGYEEPTPIQREAIPHLIAGRDLLGQAATGTGKTAAFALPILERLPERTGAAKPLALVLVPTRELAMQVSEAVYKYGRDLGAEVLPIYGGQPISRQLQVLRRGVHVVVATPGRAVDHIRRGTLPLDDVEVVVLDEADEMLDMGFAEDLDVILDATPPTRQTVLFSATMPPRLGGITRKHLNDPVRIQIGARSDERGTSARVAQRAYVVARAHKPTALGRVLDLEAPASAIVFCRTRLEVDEVAETLNGRGYRAEALHGGMNQEQRDRVMSRVRSGTADLLVATDVAARGLDIDQLTHVVNYDVPSAPESYVHRIGRVGRAGREGTAITLAEPREQRLLANIERLTRQTIPVEKIPTVADLRARQMEITLATLRESLLTDDLDPFRSTLDTLVDEFSIEAVALAAVKLAHEATTTEIDDQEIPDVAVTAKSKAKSKTKTKDRNGGWERSDATSGSKGGHGGAKGLPRSVSASDSDPDVARLWIGAGRAGGVRPKDLVGAIANETHLSGKDIGAITITENFSIVEIPESAVDEVVSTMKRTTIKGKKAKVRRDRVGPQQ